MCNTFAYIIVARHIYNQSTVILFLVPLGVFFFFTPSHPYTYFAAAIFVRSENNIYSAFEFGLVWIPISSVQPKMRKKKPEYHHSNGWWQTQDKIVCFVFPSPWFRNCRKQRKSTIVPINFLVPINLKLLKIDHGFSNLYDKSSQRWRLLRI